MAFFKFRFPGQKGADDQVAAARGPAESVEVMRRRARHRLIGAAVLVLLGVVGFPLLFDTQPRPIPVDIPIEIPDKSKVKPLAVPSDTVTMKRAVPSEASSAPATTAPAPSVARPPAAGVAASASLGAKEEVVTAHAEPKAEPKPEKPPVATAKPETKPEAKPDDGAKAKALLEGKAASEAAADKARFIVQVGAFSEAARARDARLKVEKAGLKTYTQEVDTAEGKRIRVRVGPFGTRAEADKAASKIKGLDLPASILTL